MRLTLRQLQVFVAIADHGSTTAAGQAIALSQSASSAALQELEAHFGTPLFDRIGRRLALNGHGRSSRWRLHGYIDGIADLAGRLYIVEYKLRHQLGRLDIITLGRQVRWYAWALREEGIPVAGVIYDERLNAAPKAPRVLKNGKASHDRHQMTTAARYASLCRQLGGEPQADVANALAERRWQARHLLEFTSRELDEAGLELRDAAGLVAAADRMAQPLRNASARTCPGCQFLDACPDPGDASLVDALYDRRPAKRDRQQGD